MPDASPVLLEPIGELKVTIPDSYMGDVIGDLNKRRGRVMGMNPDGEGNQIGRPRSPWPRWAPMPSICAPHPVPRLIYLPFRALRRCHSPGAGEGHRRGKGHGLRKPSNRSDQGPRRIPGAGPLYRARLSGRNLFLRRAAPLGCPCVFFLARSMPAYSAPVDNPIPGPIIIPVTQQKGAVVMSITPAALHRTPLRNKWIRWALFGADKVFLTGEADEKAGPAPVWLCCPPDGVNTVWPRTVLVRGLLHPSFPAGAVRPPAYLFLIGVFPMEQDLTAGSVPAQLIRFSLPPRGQSPQSFYNLVDMAVVGRFVGKDGLAAVSSAVLPCATSSPRSVPA